MDISLNSSDGLSLPYSLEAEQAVLGSVLIDPACMMQVQVIISADHFYLPQHKAVFSAMAATTVGLSS